jgi:hypothetical protein
MRSLVTYLGCGGYYLDLKRGFGDYYVNKFADIYLKIIPLFNQYPLGGCKAQDFEDFKQVATLVKNKDHLTPEGMRQIQLIKIGMNRGRSG